MSSIAFEYSDSPRRDRKRSYEARYRTLERRAIRADKYGKLGS